MRIQHNIPAMNAYRHYTNNTSALQRNLEKLSSGYKINKAGDDAAGLAVSEKMRAQITGLEVAQKNAKDGISLVQTAEGAMTEVHDMLNRMYELAELSSNGTYDDEVDRANYQKEIESLTDEINRIADSTNFNGINLLDGSLATSGTNAKSIEINGVASSFSSGARGVYETTVDLIDSTNTKWGIDADTAVHLGDTYSFSVAMEDGTSYEAKFTVQKNEETPGQVKYEAVGDNGTKIALKEATAGDPSAGYVIETDTDEGAFDTDAKACMAIAVRKELEKTNLGKEYIITSGPTVTGLKFTAMAEGDKAVAITGVDEKGTIGKGTTSIGGGGISLTTSKLPLNEGYEIAADDITLYDGSNYDKAMFTINSKKFVVVTYNQDAGTGGTDDWMKTTEGLGSDVTILVADKVGNNGLSSKDANFSQNIAKIAQVTGLNVTDAVKETTYGAADNSGPDSGKGIRLSASKNSVTGGLMLQIGDTSDDFNKLRVGINDMHAKAMGIGDIDVGTQEGASDAMKRIKDAINYVSNTRGDLGALQNRLDHAINNLAVAEENITDAESTIRDVDVAEEMMAYTKNNILVQAAQAMLAQANQLPQGVLQLLQ